MRQKKVFGILNQASVKPRGATSEPDDPLFAEFV